MRIEPFASLNEMRKEHGLRKTALLKVDDKPMMTMDVQIAMDIKADTMPRKVAS